MKSTWPDFSRRPELQLEAGVVRDVQSAAAALQIPVLLAGAFARDLHLRYGLGVEMSRRTEDIDFALSVPDWDAFAALRQALIDGGRFNAADAEGHRLVHESRLPVDIVPFGAVETANRLIRWPPAGAVEMDVFGFSEALATAQTVHLPGATALVAAHIDLTEPTRLPDEMAPHQPERALALLQAMQKGLRESLPTP